MRRYLPFLIIAVVALITAGGATLLYRAKMQPAATSVSLVRQGKTDNSGQLYAKGPADAAVTLEIYGDFQCPPCATTTAVIDKLQRDYGARLRVVYSEFPLQMHRFAIPAAMAAEAAGRQGHFWEMHDLLYEYQTVWSKAENPKPLFASYAESLGLDMTRFAADSQSNELMTRLMNESNAGVARGVKTTPTIFVNGKEVRGIFGQDNLRAAIDSALTTRRKS